MSSNGHDAGALPPPFSVALLSAHDLQSFPRPCLIELLGPGDAPAELDVVELGTSAFWYACRGRLRLASDGESIELPEGAAMLQEAGGVEGPPLPSSPDRDWRCLHVVFTGAGEMVREVLARYGRRVRVPPETSILKQLLAFQRVDGARPDIGLSEGARLVVSLLATLVSHAGQEDGSISKPVRLVQRALRHIRSHLHEAFSVAELAEALGVSAEHLARVVTKELGQPPNRVIIREKMARACELLKDSSDSVAEIAHALGYTSASHFARSFRQEFGVTPTQYRASSSASLL